jgi:hypothetical protein
MLFDDASSQFLRKTSAMGAFSISLWFNPDDLTIDQTLYSESNAAGTAYFRVRLLGASGGDTVVCQYTTAGLPTTATSSGTANANAWNHVFASMGVNTTRPYVSLNGEALQNGSTVAFGGGTPNQTNLGRMNNGVGAFNQYYSGQMGAFGAWDSPLNDYDDRWKNLYYGSPVWDIATDPNGTYGGGLFINLLSDTKLMGNIVDNADGAAAWLTTASPTVTADYPRIRRRE